MFDIDISKMAVIGTVALVVLGPERLPRVARTAGALLGRAQRYLNGVRAEVDRQIRIEELRKMKDGIELAVTNMQGTVDRAVRQHAGELQAGVDAAASLKEVSSTVYLPSVHDGANDLQADLFKVRPAQWPMSGQSDASIHAPRPDVVSSMAPAFSSQQARARRRGSASGGRGAAVKRTRVVSMAASKALGRNGGRLA
ncbi:sec-independent protein translocase protein TatB [Paraburkholderia sp. BL23I1N1]|uniref:Sec-independent protein translocase protein TatB n=1 Tax=Paraburkholderia sp. BL23I1N1 TaxID=1938802 RepID=UPI000E75071D|nr:Sec-independent protein translocase protein TatB [Paraburkholderia sp. BL23I1N1]RKE40124.1 sec-independent protein translocase protein TatB [Paraburkholderia sp. BL23I1N1]